VSQTRNRASWATLRVGSPSRLVPETSRRWFTKRLRTPPQAREGVLARETSEADELGILEKIGDLRRRLSVPSTLELTPVHDLFRRKEKDRLAPLARHHRLRDAPGRSEPIRGAQHHHAPALPQALPKVLLPLGPGRDAVVRMRVEKQVLIAMAPQGLADAAGPGLVLAAVADEECRQRRLLVVTSNPQRRFGPVLTGRLNGGFRVHRAC
jgi:hypothetical protein